jgi:hypothetical protein
MSANNQTTEYSAVVSGVRSAIRKDNESQTKWKDAGELVRSFYVTEAAITEVKAQFLADAVIPELKKEHQAALVRELPRKGSADYVAFITAHGADAWETANQAKKDARSIAHTMFSRVVGHAFPKEKAERVATPTTTKLVELINDAIRRAQKDEAPTYDVSTLVGHLTAALAIVK